jgi:hypothetical protein
MTARTYRVQVTGQFAHLTPARKGQLLEEQATHDVLVSAFTPAGTFTYTTSLTRFTLRYLLEVDEDSAAEADAAALVEGELLATDMLESHGLTHKPLIVSAVCLQDVKVKRRR